MSDGPVEWESLDFDWNPPFDDSEDPGQDSDGKLIDYVHGLGDPA